VKQDIDKTNSLLGSNVSHLPLSGRVLSRCKEILNRTLQQKDKGSLWFKDPVDEDSSGAFGYYSIITHPMDLTTLRKRYLEGSKVVSNAILLDFINDGRIIWQNSFRFNDASTEPYKCANKLALYWEHQVRQAFRSFRHDHSSAESFNPTEIAFDLPLSRTEFETLSDHLQKLNPASQSKFFEMVNGITAKGDSDEKNSEAKKRSASQDIDLALLPPVKMRELASFVEREYKLQNPSSESSK